MVGVTCWEVLGPLPADLKLHYPSPEGAHPLTPEAVRTRYTESVRAGRAALWQADGCGGIRAGIDEVAWRDVDEPAFELQWVRPSKGPGDVVLFLHARGAEECPLLSARGFSVAVLGWLEALADRLERLYPAR